MQRWDIEASSPTPENNSYRSVPHASQPADIGAGQWVKVIAAMFRSAVCPTVPLGLHDLVVMATSGSINAASAVCGVSGGDWWRQAGGRQARRRLNETWRLNV